MAGRPPFRLIDSKTTRALKKPLFFKLILGFASLFVLVLPIAASAGTFSFITSLLGKTTDVSNAQGPVKSFNSQTVPLLTPVNNFDPSPPVGGGDIVVVGSALVAEVGPSGTAVDETLRPTASQISVYTVRTGDTLGSIAKMFGVSVNTIVWANDIKGGVIHPGDELIILPITGLRHTIEKGETLASLATKYKSDAHDIAQYNDLTDSATLAVGSVVMIPNGESAAPPPTTTAKKKKVGTEPYLGGSGPTLSGFFAWPVDGGIITQGLHGWNGVDIGAPKGTAIFAAAAGTVIVVKGGGGWNGGYGNYVVVQHSNGTQTLYAHASKLEVSQGDEVTQGEEIAKVGATGQATGPHLHFEVRGAQNPFASLSVGASL